MRKHHQAGLLVLNKVLIGNILLLTKNAIFNGMNDAKGGFDRIEHTPAVIYSLGEQRLLNYKKIHMCVTGVWKDDESFGTSYHLNSDTATIINPLDEDPLSRKNISEHAQYQHGGVKVNGTKLCFGLVFRVVSSEESYHLKSNKMIVDYLYDMNDTVDGIVGYDYVPFHNALQWLYYNRFYSN